MKANYVTFDKDDFEESRALNGDMLIRIPVRTLAKARSVLGENASIRLDLDLNLRDDDE